MVFAPAPVSTRRRSCRERQQVPEQRGRVVPGHVRDDHRGADLRCDRRAREVQHVDAVRALWVTFDYAPMAHMVWNNGLLSAKGPISTAIGAAAHDFAGGTVVHINAAMAALIIVLIIGKRKGFGTQPIRPHNVPFVMLGAFLLWFGWFGFNAGSAFAANGTAGYAWMSTTAATAAAMLAWGFTEKIRTGHYTAIGAASGIVAGLVAITPAADVVSPLWAMVIARSPAFCAASHAA